MEKTDKKEEIPQINAKKSEKTKKFFKNLKKKIRYIFSFQWHIKRFLTFLGLMELEDNIEPLFKKWTGGLIQWFFNRYISGFIFNWSLLMLFGIRLNWFTPLAFGILLFGIPEFIWKIKVKA